MSVDLGIPHWRIAGVVGGHVIVTHARERRTRWVDARTWPGKLYPARDELVRAVGGDALLVGSQLVIQRSPTHRRTTLALPDARACRATGVVGGRRCIVPPAVHEGGRWHLLGGRPGRDPARNAVVGAFVIWEGRVHRLGDTLAELGELPAGGSDHVATADGFFTCGGGKLIGISQRGERRADRAIGRLAVTSIVRHDGRVLVGDGERFHAYDEATGTHEPFDLGVPRVDALVAAPCGLLALVDRGRYLKRLRSSA